MSIPELRALAVTIDGALDVFRPYSVVALSPDETRARLSLSSASRQVKSALHARMREQLDAAKRKSPAPPGERPRGRRTRERPDAPA